MLLICLLLFLCVFWLVVSIVVIDCGRHTLCLLLSLWCESIFSVLLASLFSFAFLPFSRNVARIRYRRGFEESTAVFVAVFVVVCSGVQVTGKGGGKVAAEEVFVLPLTVFF